MIAQRPRRFSIADAMILVVASAIGATILRPYLPAFFAMQDLQARIYPDPWKVQRGLFWFSGVGSCIVIPLMAGMIAIRLKPPAPSRKRLASQPGFVACVAVMISLLPGVIWYGTIAHRPGFQRNFGFQQAWGAIQFTTSTAVLGAWLALACSRRWRPEASWIDRLGRVLGAYWIILNFGTIIYDCVKRASDLLSRLGSG